MRIGLILLPLSLCAAPALAQAAPAQPDAMQLPPDTADRITSAMQSLSDAVRDLAGPDNPGVARDVDRRIAATKPQIEQSINAINRALPEITQDLQRAQQSIERALANMPDPNYPRR